MTRGVYECVFFECVCVHVSSADVISGSGVVSFSRFTYCQQPPLPAIPTACTRLRRRRDLLLFLLRARVILFKRGRGTRRNSSSRPRRGVKHGHPVLAGVGGVPVDIDRTMGSNYVHCKRYDTRRRAHETGLKILSDGVRGENFNLKLSSCRRRSRVLLADSTRQHVVITVNVRARSSRVTSRSTVSG